jgi:protein TonB
MPRLTSCPAKFDDGLATNGVIPMGSVSGVAVPKLMWAPQAEFTEKARKEIHKRAIFPFVSVSTIDVVVDRDGKPRDLCVQHSAEFDLDKAAAESVRQYRFEPATKDGKPVAKRLAVEVKFAMK